VEARRPTVAARAGSPRPSAFLRAGARGRQERGADIVPVRMPSISPGCCTARNSVRPPAVTLYSNLALGMVMSGTVVLNLVVAALAGVAIPLGLHTAGRDPAHGSSVLLTFVTDAMGFLLFLRPATVFLL
jgi:hypothetical protein